QIDLRHAWYLNPDGTKVKGPEKLAFSQVLRLAHQQGSTYRIFVLANHQLRVLSADLQGSIRCLDLQQFQKPDDPESGVFENTSDLTAKCRDGIPVVSLFDYVAEYVSDMRF